MKEGRFASTATLGAAALTLGLVTFAVLQLHYLEERLIVQGQQIRALGEATERLSSQGVRVGGSAGTGAGPATAKATDEPAKVLHPEVPNYLKPNDKGWPAPGARTDGVLSRGWHYGEPKGFNSLLENAAEVGELVDNYVSAVLAARNDFTNPDDWHGELATRVEITDDHKEFTIYLRPGVKWHPVPNVNLSDPKYAWLRKDQYVTTRDLVFTFDMIMNPQVQNGFLKNAYAEIESYRALDDHTLVVRWKKKQFTNISATIGLGPMPEFLYAHDEDGKPIPKETIGARFNRHWYNNKGVVGAGPYRMESYEAGSRIRLVRNEEFYGHKPAVRELVYPIYSDPQQTLLKLKAQNIDLGILQPGQYREEVQQYEGKPGPKTGPFLDGRIQCQKVPKHGYYYLGWNADKPLFADKRVRRAMTLALDRKSLVDKVFVGLGQVAVGPYLADSPNNDPSIQPLPFDLDGARKLLAEAGWTDTDGDGLVDKELRPGDKKRTPFAFTLLAYGTSKEWSALANILKENLLKIGVKMGIDAAEWSLMQKRMNEKQFDAFTGGWGLGWETDLYQIWHSSQADVPQGSNRIAFRNKEADGIIEKARVTFDPQERIELFRRFHRIVHEEQAVTFVVARTEPACWWNNVKDVEFAKTRPVVNTLPWSVAKGAN